MRRSFFIGFLLSFLVLSLTPLWAQSTGSSGVEVVSSVEGARVYVNGTLRGATAAEFGANRLRVGLLPGEYEIRVEIDNYAPVEDQITVASDGYVRFDAVFSGSSRRVESGQGRAQSAQINTGTIVVRTVPLGATVELNSSRLGTTQNGDLTIAQEAVGHKHIEVYFNRNSPSEFLEIEFQLVADDQVTVIADFYAGTIVIDTTYRVSFNSGTPGAAVTVAGGRPSSLPTSLEVPYGSLAVEFSAPGYQSQSESLVVDRNLMVTRTLAPLDRSVTVRTTPSGAQISSGRSSMGTTPRTIATTDRELLLHLEPPSRYPRLLAEDVEISMAVDQTSATVSHVFEARPSATVSFAAMEAATSFHAEIAVPGQSSPVSLGSRYGRPVEVEAGNVEITFFSGTERAGTVTASLGEGHSYELRFAMAGEPEEYLRDASGLPGYREPAPEPSYLNEFSQSRVATGRTFDQPLVQFQVALGAGGMAGIITAAVINGFDSTNVSGRRTGGILVGLGVGGALLWLQSEPKYETTTVPVPNAADQNRIRREQWEASRADTEAHNDSLLDEYNAGVSERRAEANRTGQYRFRAEITDVATGRPVTVQVQ